MKLFVDFDHGGQREELEVCWQLEETEEEAPPSPLSTASQTTDFPRPSIQFTAAGFLSEGKEKLEEFQRR